MGDGKIRREEMTIQFIPFDDPVLQEALLFQSPGPRGNHWHDALGHFAKSYDAVTGQHKALEKHFGPSSEASSMHKQVARSFVQQSMTPDQSETLHAMFDLNPMVRNRQDLPSHEGRAEAIMDKGQST